MILFIAYFILFIFYLLIGISQLNSQPALIILISGAIPFLNVLMIFFIKHNLKAYFWFKRTVNKIKNPTSKWNIVINYEGEFDKNTIMSLSEKLLDKDFINRPVKVMSRTVQSLNFVIDDTLNLYLEYENAKFDTSIEKDNISIIFPTFEISCNNSIKKLNQEIVPLLQKFYDYFKPDTCSYALNIDYMGKNPFYTVFIDRLKLDQIDDFNVNLHFGEYQIGSKKDRVTINKDKIHIMTTALNNLKELAKDFIFLTPDLSRLLQYKHRV